jgi:hypothetical protein
MILFLSPVSKHFPQFLLLIHPNIWSRSWGSIVSVVIRLQTNNRNYDAISGRSEEFFFSLKHVDQLWGQSILLFSGISPGIKWLRHETNHFPPSSAFVACTPTFLPYTLSNSGVALWWGTKFDTHIKWKAKLLFCIF